VKGDVDFHTAPQIVEAIAALLTEGHLLVHVCLKNVEFMDSTGISALLNSVRFARESDARIVLVSPSQQLMHFLDVSGFKQFFEFESVPSARFSFPESEASPLDWEICEFSVPCHPELVADIRRRVAQVAESLPFTPVQIQDIKLAVGEAAANAYRHGRPSDLGTIHVRCVGDSDKLVVDIMDSGPGFDPSQVHTPEEGSLEEGHRGIFFMRLSMDEVTYERLNPGMRVRMVKYVTRF
jgi:anti-anti-sigma factor